MKAWFYKNRRRLVVALVCFLVFFIAGYVAVGWYLSSQLINLGLQKIDYDQVVVARNGDQFTVKGSAYDVDGVMGAQWNDGLGKAIMSRPTNVSKDTQTSSRDVVSGSAESLLPDVKLALIGNIWDGDPKSALGIEFKDVTYRAPLGETAAWYVPAASASDKWVIGVHGIGASKAEFLRFIKPVHESGFNMLVIDYRGDQNAPKASDGYTRLGDTEWQDLEAAVKYAKEQGAREVNLYGISLGGSIVQNFLRRSDVGKDPLIDRVVLDSPALDWDSIIAYRLKQKGFPSVLKYPGKDLASVRAGIDFNRVSSVNKPEDISRPTLIFHGSGDKSIPNAPSKRLAEARPDMIKFLDFGNAAHARSWNFDQQKYETELKNFLLNNE